MRPGMAWEDWRAEVGEDRSSKAICKLAVGGRVTFLPSCLGIPMVQKAEFSTASRERERERW